MSRFPDEAPPLIERGCAPVYFVNGIGRIQNLPGGNFLITLFRTDERNREIELKIVVAKCDLEIMLRAADGAMRASDGAGNACADVAECYPRRAAMARPGA